MFFDYKCKVLKPRPDRTVRPGKPRAAHFCGSFSLKNRSMGKKQGPVRTAVRPHGSENHDQIASHGSLLPLNLNLKKHTHREKQKKKKHNYRESRKHAGLAVTRRHSSNMPTRLFFFFFDPQSHYFSFSFILVSESFWKRD